MKDNYKKTKLGWIPKEWEVVKIEDITKVVRGASPRPKGDPRYYGGKVPRLMGKDVTRDGKYVTPCVDFLTEEGALRSRFMIKGTLVMVCSGNVGVPSILKVDACVHDGFLAFPEIDVNSDVEFLYYIFDSFQTRFNNSATHGGVFTNLTTTIIKEFQIPLPPLPEQQKIAKILSTIDAKLNNISDQITATQTLKKGLMQQLLTEGIGHSEFKDSKLGRIPKGWEVKQLNQVTSYVDYRGKTPPKVDNGIFLVTAKNIRNGKIDYELSKEYIPIKLYNTVMSRGKPKIGDVLITTEAPLGHIASVDNTNIALAQRVIKYRGESNLLNNEYLKYCFLGEYFQGNLNKNSTGSTVKGIKGSVLHKQLILLPPLSEQKKIAVILSKVDEKLSVLDAQRMEYGILKKGMMQVLLTGEVRVN
jgi:type I restriction enzyme S subunit